MYYTVTDAGYVRDFTIWAKFVDESAGEIDLANELWGPVFEPLKDVSYFRNFSLAPYGTICWPNGADIAPEFLHENVRKRCLDTDSRRCVTRNEAPNVLGGTK
jgi:hypothetical protein